MPPLLGTEKAKIARPSMHDCITSVDLAAFIHAAMVLAARSRA
jgi:hypothetical protein